MTRHSKSLRVPKAVVSLHLFSPRGFLGTYLDTQSAFCIKVVQCPELKSRPGGGRVRAGYSML